ncbi:MAG: hypothetical protein IJH67_07365 [Thermoguttaceae bacterium]|nr:hypothetical protein [Thermoguttaceae bacterium]
MKQYIISAVIFVTVLTSIASARTWTDAKGKKVSADFVSLIQDGEPKVKLQTPSGKIIVAPLRNFSKEDQEYIQGLGSKPAAAQPTQNVTQSAVFSAVKNFDIDSREAYDAIIEVRNNDPTKLEPDYTLALLFIFKNKDYLHAQQHFTRCQRIRPDNPSVLLNMGTLSVLQEKYPEAFAYYQKAYVLGGANPALKHNLHKLIIESDSRNIFIPPVVQSRIAELASKVTQQDKTPFNPKQGWMFEKCPEGTAQEMFKCTWFQIDGYQPYEFPVCVKCKGTGKVECPNKNCSGGRATVYVTKTQRHHNGGKVTAQVPQTVICSVCKGKNFVPCPVCQGTGLEYHQVTIDENPQPKADAEKRNDNGHSKPRQNAPKPQVPSEPKFDNRPARMGVDVQDLETLQEDAAESRRFFGLEDDEK